MQRLRLNDAILSELPQILGLVQRDTPRIAQAVNRAQERLLYCEEANEESWTGTWSEMAFSVDRKHPYITCPRGVSRLEAIDACQRPIPLRNQFSEYLLFGTGRLPKMGRWNSLCHNRWHSSGQARNYTPTFTDIDPPNQQIQIFALNTADTQKNPQTGAIPRVLLQGRDSNGNIITSMDGNNLVQGEFVTLASPYALSVNTFSTIDGIQKDVTQGEVQIFQSDPIWGMAEILVTMEPTETTAWYRRYQIVGIPPGCCPTFRSIVVNKQPPTCDCPYPIKEYVQVTALAKLDLIPAVVPTDYLLIQSLEAIIAECQSIRMSKMDDAESRTQTAIFHKQAIAILRGQGIDREGKNNASVSYAPFGNADLRRLNIGML